MIQPPVQDFVLKAESGKGLAGMLAPISRAELLKALRPLKAQARYRPADWDFG